MNDDELRKAYQARRAVASGTGPSPEELQRLVAREGSEDERLEILDRALSNPATARELELLRATAMAAAAPPGRGWWRVPAAIAATILIVVAVWSQRGRPREETRATPDDGGPVLLAPAADARVADSVAFMWRAVPGARSYRVELLTDAGTLVISIRTADTTAHVAVPAAGGDSTYRWLVVALLPEGVEVPSRPRRVILKAP